MINRTEEYTFNYLMKLGSFLIVVFLNIFSGFAQTDDVIKIINPEQLLLIGSQISYLEDPTGELAIEDILKSDNQSRFIKNDKNVFNRPGTKSAFWFKITIQNHCEEDAWIEFGSTYAWYIDFYIPDSIGQYNEEIQTGTMRPDDNKLYNVNLFWLPLNKADDKESKIFYARIVSGLTYELPIQVGTIRSLSKNKDINDFLTAGFIGLLIIMLLYNAFIYFSIKDHIYFFYLGYLFLMAISMPYANGYPFIEKLDFLFFNKEWWNNNFLLWHPPVYYFIGTFCIRYLNLAKNGPIIRRLIQLEMLIISGIFPLLTLLGFGFVQLVNAIQVFILIFYLTCLITGYYIAYKKVKQAYYYVLGWTFMVTGAFIFFAVINGFLPFNPFTRNMLYFGVSLEVWMFSLALGNRLNILQKDKDKIKLENLKLIEGQKELLEVKVKERTEELELINNKLVQSNEELSVTTEMLDSQSQELKKLNSTKDRLFAIIGHDLSSPIYALKNLMNLVSDHNLTTEKFVEISNKLKNSVEHVLFTLTNMLHWASSQMQGMSTKQQNIKLYSLVHENILLLHEFSQNKNIKIFNNINKDMEVYADSDQVKLIFRNLLNNALKYTKSGGEVRLGSSVKNSFCEISITDTGIGMSNQLLEILFKDQYIESKFGTEDEKGTGLGLVLCKDFVEKNGGKIWAESKVGKGSTFYVTLILKSLNKIT